MTTDMLRPVGAYCQLEALIALRHQSKQLQLAQRKKALSLLAGPNKTNFRGRGIDFEEVRRYQPGDDIRTIDWRVTARSGSAHTKLFREERERPVLIVVDQRSSMFFGSQTSFKSVTAGHIAALVAWSGLHTGDRIGGLVFNERTHREVRPKRSRKTVLTLLHHLAEMNNELPLGVIDHSFKFSDMLVDLRRIARPGSAVFLISDFTGANSAAASEQFYQLSRHTEVTAIQVTDSLEDKLPPVGRYTVTDGQNRAEVVTGDPVLRQQYSRDRQEEVEQLKQQFGRSGVPFIRLLTDASPLETLQQYYGKSAGGILR